MDSPHKARILENLVDRFLDDLQRETGVSSIFLMSARPAVERMFSQIPEHLRATARERVLSVSREQARTEAHLAEVLTQLRRFDGDTSLSTEGREHTLRQIATTRTMVVNTLLRSWGAFGDTAPIFS